MLYFIIGGVLLLLMVTGGNVAGRAVSLAEDLIKQLEGFRETPYWDVSQWSVGYGTAVGYDPGNRPVLTVSREQAAGMARDRLRSLYGQLYDALKVPLSATQWAALLSFAYNVGLGTSASGALAIVRRINEGLPAKQVAEAMKLYVYSGGQVNNTLVARRKIESELFMA